VGIESVPEAVEDAKYNANMNQIKNTYFESGDMKKLFNETFISRHGKPDIVITDPPRDGMHPNVVKQLLLLNAPKIVYVSCNSATQARDLALLSDQYMVEQSQAIDLFPQTGHVENVVLLSRK
jgi:23S rRNA (uracil1939-C5)-methyltransferase